MLHGQSLGSCIIHLKTRQNVLAVVSQTPIVYFVENVMNADSTR